MIDRRKVVWILGSGFSKALGGPLLKDLLTTRRRDLVDATFSTGPNPPFTNARRTAYEIFDWYRETPTKPGYWADAEEFLDFLDVACQPKSKKRTLLERLVKDRTPTTTIEELRDWALVSVASECSTYTEDFDPESESASPYVHWRSNLVKTPDAIITFNYDAVLESLGRYAPGGPFGVQSVVPPYGGKPIDPMGVPILKLHGSVDWLEERDNPATFYMVSSIKELGEPDNRKSLPLIAAPGATKKKLSTGPFGDLWLEAERQLILADVIVFIGYRFPQSDSHARSEILGAIASNNAPYLRVHTVLGPHLNEADTVRLTNMLHHTMRRAGKKPNDDPAVTPNVQEARKQPVYDLIPQPLWAEDFMSVADDKEIFGSHPHLIYRDESLPLVEIADDGTIVKETRAVFRR